VPLASADVTTTRATFTLDEALAEVGRKRRPVLVLTRTEVLDVRSLVTVAEITTSARGLAAEVEIDHRAVGLDRACVVNGDGLHTVAESMLTTRVGEVEESTLARVCVAVSDALGC
jgi:mRNA interferase MazF